MNAIRQHGRPEERGIAMLEVAITLPVILLMVAGITSWWNLESKRDLILSAARHGARAGAATAKLIVAQADPADACSDTSGSSRVLTNAVGLSFKYLNAARLESAACTPGGGSIRSCAGSSFDVSARFEKICEDNLPQTVVTVRVASNPAIRCLFCIERVFESIDITEQVSFAVEADCAEIDTLSCP